MNAKDRKERANRVTIALADAREKETSKQRWQEELDAKAFEFPYKNPTNSESNHNPNPPPHSDVVQVPPIRVKMVTKMKRLYDAVVGPPVTFTDETGTRSLPEREVDWHRMEATQRFADNAFELTKTNTHKLAETEHDIQTDLIIAERLSTEFEQELDALENELDSEMVETQNALIFMKNKVFDSLSSIGEDLHYMERKMTRMISETGSRLEEQAQDKANQELLFKEMSIREREREKERVAGRAWAEAKAKKEADEKRAEEKWEAYQQQKYRDELRRIRGEGLMRRVVRRLSWRDLSDIVMIGWRPNYVEEQGAKRQAALKRMELARGPKKDYKNAHKADSFVAAVGEAGLSLAQDVHNSGEVNAAELHKAVQDLGIKASLEEMIKLVTSIACFICIYIIAYRSQLRVK